MLSVAQQPVIRLATGIELLAGPNDMPLLYVRARNSYLRLSKAGAAFIRLLQSRGEIAQAELRQSDSLIADATPQQLTQFLQQLQDAGALANDGNNNASAPSLFKRIGRHVSLRPRFELPLWRPNRPLCNKALNVVQARFAGGLKRVIVLSLLCSLAIVTYTTLSLRPSLNTTGLPALLIVTLLLLHTAGHEMAHALVSSYYGVKVRELGVALLYYFMPVAYTDRTDAYRLRHFRSRAYIALAGPAFDLLVTASSAVIANVASGQIAMTFRALMWLQLAGFVTTLNPLLPGDGCHALEAWCGALNFRGRAFTLFWRRLTWRALPPHLQGLTTRQQVWHFGYAALSSLYVLLMAWGVLSFAVIRATTVP